MSKSMTLQNMIKEIGYKPFGWWYKEESFTATVYITDINGLLKQLSLLIIEKLDMKIISLIEAKTLINSMFNYTIPMDGTIIWENERWEE